jgi:hypothetical protein
MSCFVWQYAAFVEPLAASRLPVASTIWNHSTSSSTQLFAAPMQDYSSAAVAFFTSIRVPSALVAGSQLGSLFSLVKLLQEDEERKMTSLQSWMLRIYHLFSLTAFVLSINAIVTSTAAATKLLVGHRHNGMAESAYQFIDRELRYEFILTRWSFLISLLSFLAGITIRALLEFNLLDRRRRRAAIVVASSMAGLFCHLLSFVNSTLISSPNLAVMTVEVIKVRYRECLRLFSTLFGSLSRLPKSSCLEMPFGRHESH